MHTAGLSLEGFWVLSGAGADPEIEEGGGIHIKWELVQRSQDAVVCARASLVLDPRPSCIRRLQYVTQKPENEATYIRHAQSGL